MVRVLGDEVSIFSRPLRVRAPIPCYNTVLWDVQSTQDHTVTLKWNRLVSRKSFAVLALIRDICVTSERSIFPPRSTALVSMAMTLVLVVSVDVSASTHNVACERTGHHPACRWDGNGSPPRDRLQLLAPSELPIELALLWTTQTSCPRLSARCTRKLSHTALKLESLSRVKVPATRHSCFVPSSAMPPHMSGRCPTPVIPLAARRRRGSAGPISPVPPRGRQRSKSCRMALPRPSSNLTHHFIP